MCAAPLAVNVYFTFLKITVPVTPVENKKAKISQKLLTQTRQSRTSQDLMDLSYAG